MVNGGEVFGVFGLFFCFLFHQINAATAAIITSSPTTAISIDLVRDCSEVTIKVVGYSAGGACSNAIAGIAVRPVIDGKLVPISEILTYNEETGEPEYRPYNDGTYMVMDAQAGPRTAEFKIKVPVNSITDHKLDIRVGAVGEHGRITYSTFQDGISTCDDSKQPCYIQISTNYSCKQKLACGISCTSRADCAGTWDTCTECLEKEDGTGKTCQAPPPPVQCGANCMSDKNCQNALNGCTSCLPSLTDPKQKTCQTAAACGSACSTPASCVGAKDGCTSCIKGATGGATCGTCPAGMSYDSTQMKCVCPNPGETNPHGVCDGDKCTNVNTCGITECTTDKQCFADEMCKCDGFDATTLEYPSTNPFSFQAFAKVEGTDISKALVEGIQFKMSESDKSNPNVGTIIAESPMYTPEIVSASSQKVRYKATWNLTPPQIKPNKT